MACWYSGRCPPLCTASIGSSTSLNCGGTLRFYRHESCPRYTPAMAWGRIPVAELKERQGRKLHQFLTKKVVPYSPFYRELFRREKLDPDRFRTIADLRHLPFSSKADLAPTDASP